MKRICYLLKQRFSILLSFSVLQLKDIVVEKINCPDKDENFQSKKMLWEDIVEGVNCFDLPLSLSYEYRYTIEEHNFTFFQIYFKVFDIYLILFTVLIHTFYHTMILINDINNGDVVLIESARPKI